MKLQIKAPVKSVPLNEVKLARSFVPVSSSGVILRSIVYASFGKRNGVNRSPGREWKIGKRSMKLTN
jgi:hypothetical protein